jgi:hypothetical protein
MKELKYKVRFHLAKGPNYQRWQVRYGDQVDYYDPEDVTLDMYGCKLCNQRKTAEAIHNGENKTVCAWVQCDHLEVKPRHEHTLPDPKGFVAVRYNPREAPYWYQDNRERNVDNMRYVCLTTIGRLIVIPDLHAEWKLHVANIEAEKSGEGKQSEDRGTNSED